MMSDAQFQTMVVLYTASRQASRRADLAHRIALRHLRAGRVRQGVRAAWRWEARQRAAQSAARAILAMPTK